MKNKLYLLSFRFINSIFGHFAQTPGKILKSGKALGGAKALKSVNSGKKAVGYTHQRRF